jgi:hypothetical protein
VVAALVDMVMIVKAAMVVEAVEADTIVVGLATPPETTAASMAT